MSLSEPPTSRMSTSVTVPSLQQYKQQSTNIANLSETPTQTQQILCAACAKLKSIDGIQACSDTLQSLIVQNCPDFEDVSVLKTQQFLQLRELKVTNCKKFIQIDLLKVTNLKIIDISNTQLKSVSTFLHLQNLENLKLKSNQIHSFEALRDLISLINLDLSFNPLDNPDELQIVLELPNLTVLRINNTNLTKQKREILLLQIAFIHRSNLELYVLEENENQQFLNEVKIQQIEYFPFGNCFVPRQVHQQTQQVMRKLQQLQQQRQKEVEMIQNQQIVLKQLEEELGLLQKEYLEVYQDVQGQAEQFMGLLKENTGFAE